MRRKSNVFRNLKPIRLWPVVDETDSRKRACQIALERPTEARNAAAGFIAQAVAWFEGCVEAPQPVGCEKAVRARTTGTVIRFLARFWV